MFIDRFVKVWYNLNVEGLTIVLGPFDIVAAPPPPTPPRSEGRGEAQITGYKGVLSVGTSTNDGTDESKKWVTECKNRWRETEWGR